VRTFVTPGGFDPPKPAVEVNTVPSGSVSPWVHEFCPLQVVEEPAVIVCGQRIEMVSGAQVAEKPAEWAALARSNDAAMIKPLIAHP
jgi:hypothetical protein